MVKYELVMQFKELREKKRVPVVRHFILDSMADCAAYVTRHRNNKKISNLRYKVVRNPNWH